jgi:hypothetical protein
MELDQLLERIRARYITTLTPSPHDYLLNTKKRSSSSRYFWASAIGPAAREILKILLPVPMGVSSTEMIMSIPN